MGQVTSRKERTVSLVSFRAGAAGVLAVGSWVFTYTFLVGLFYNERSNSLAFMRLLPVRSSAVADAMFLELVLIIVLSLLKLFQPALFPLLVLEKSKRDR